MGGTMHGAKNLVNYWKLKFQSSAQAHTHKILTKILSPSKIRNYIMKSKQNNLPPKKKQQPKNKNKQKQKPPNVVV